MAPVLSVLAGLAALIVGAELVVRYGSRLARRLGVPPMIVGLTVVSIGTSIPELAVGVDAMRANAGSLAIGNIAGTNVVNLLLILGLSAAVRPIAIERRTRLLDLPGMAVAAVLLFVFTLGGRLDRWMGFPLIGFAVAYTVLLVLWTRGENARDQHLAAEYEHEFPAEPSQHGGRLLAWFGVLLIAGIAVIVVGADWLVHGSVELARIVGVSDAFIGLTIVAIGTSAPELVTTVISTIRGDRDIAIGNLIGSSVYNLTLILGVPVLVADGSGPIDAQLLHIDLPVMVAVSLLCVPLFLTGKRLSRTEGVLFVAGYVVYLTYLLLTRT
ncbi:MAG: calcium/sodium antiporter [Propionicimonas sp.]|uniref:calcium/sodium antiporter n=1 Tax=Propionicimonas sp. TaxID=1955623 RepID=UPI002B1F4A23|nr:calcium/sodium antiporter [Propionicimonas sp.]MEA4945736.1 calcium/sodium antiporter [Propionicimonas sp.]MEA5052783.1 calcium/sodium antiporter [Propionicimonas sp.]MEA5118276.1 calcium/sodium antiporter [Propionicimonas sp.]